MVCFLKNSRSRVVFIGDYVLEVGCFLRDSMTAIYVRHEGLYLAPVYSFLA
jgi:hypothetical protein